MFSRQKYSVIFLSCLMFTLLLSAGCGSKEVAPVDPDAVKNELVGKVWFCEMLFQREVDDESKLTLEFMEDGTVKGNGGCNDFSGEYTLAGDKLSFGPLMSTKKACSPATDEQEYTYLTFLALIHTVNVDDDEMEMFGEGVGVPMTFTTDEGGFLW